jgi:uncharacterized protein YkwD
MHFTAPRPRRWILVLCALAALVASASATARAEAAAPAATDWTAVSANTATGTLLGTSVSLSGTHVWSTPTSRLDESWPYFAGHAFSPALPKSDVIQISGAPGYSYTIRFGAPITDPILELGSLGSRIDFPRGTRLTRLSGESAPGRNFTVNTGNCPTGSCVSGTPNNAIGASGNSDSSGTIKLEGSYTSGSTLTFTTTPNYSGPEDGILVQLVTQPTTDPPTCAGADTPITQANLAAAEDTIVCLTNLERRKAGLAPLTVNATLQGTARAHSQDMVQRRYFQHYLSGEPTECQRITAAGYRYGWCGENIASDPSSAVTPNKFMYDPQTGWMTHPPGPDGHQWHRENILNPNFKDIGVGVVVGYYKTGPGSAGATATQDFGSPA